MLSDADRGALRFAALYTGEVVRIREVQRVAERIVAARREAPDSDFLANLRRDAGAEALREAAWEVQKIINHWSSVPSDVLAERTAELADLEACRDRITDLLVGEGS